MEFTRVGNELIIQLHNREFVLDYNEEFEDGIHQLSLEWIPEMVQWRSSEDYAEICHNVEIILMNAIEDEVDFDTIVRYYVIFLTEYYVEKMSEYVGEEDGILSLTRPASTYVHFDETNLVSKLNHDSKKNYFTFLNEIIKRYTDRDRYRSAYQSMKNGRSILKELNEELDRLVDEIGAKFPNQEFSNAMKVVCWKERNVLKTDFSSKSMIDFYTAMSKVSLELKKMLLKEVNVPFHFPHINQHFFLNMPENTEESYPLVFAKLYQELKAKNEELTKQQKMKDKMIKQYAHTWTNLLFPNWVLEIAKSLISMTADEKTSMKQKIQTIMQVYRSEVTLKEECKMLEMTHSGDIAKFQAYITEGITKASPRAISMKKMVAVSLCRVLNRLFADKNHQRMIKIREQLTSNGYDLEKLEESFYKILLTDEERIFSWFNKEFYQLDLVIEKSWEEFSVIDESGANAFFSGLFSELLLNALTYGGKGDGSFVSISLKEKEIRGTDYLTLTMTNDTKKEMREHRGGLKGWGEKLRIFNSVQQKVDRINYAIPKSKDGEYSVHVYFRKDQLMKEDVHVLSE